MNPEELKDILGGVKGSLQSLEEIIRQESVKRYGQRLSELPQEELIADIIRRTSEPYKTFQINLSQGQTTPIEFGSKGGVFQVIGSTNNDLSAFIDVRFNTPSASPVRLFLGDRVVTPFQKVWISYPATPGISLTLGIGLEFGNIFRLDKNFSGNLGSVSVINNIEGLTRIPSGATEVSAVGYFNDIAGAAIYTVPAGQTLYVQCAGIESNIGPANIISSNLEHQDSGGAFVKQLLTCNWRDSEASKSYLPPLVIPAGEQIVFEGRNGVGVPTNVYGVAFITGWLI